jgi:four helix bundle protein
MPAHESLEAWREARSVALASFGLAKSYWKPWAAAIFSQLQRSALSVMLNIAEGWSYSRGPTCNRHLAVAYGSAIETTELLAMARDLELLPPEVIQPLLEHSRRSQRLLVGLLKRRRPLA